MRDRSDQGAARGEAEQALVESEERFRETSERLAKVLDSSLDVICTFDAEGRFTQVSAACERMWGYRPDELLGTPFLDLVHPDDRAKTRAVDARILAGSPTINFENRYLRKDGSVVHMRWSAWWSEEDQSNFCVAHDNTETRKAEAETRDLAERLSETLESITDGFFTIDRDWRFTYLNNEAARLFRREREAVLGRIAWDVFPEAVGTGFHREYARSLAENVPVQFEEFYPTNRWFEVRAYPSAQGLAVYFRDVSEQHSAREALQVSEEHYRLMFEQTSIAKTITSLDFTFVRANDAFLRLVGYTMEELTTMDFLAITHPDDVAQNIEDARRLAAGEIDHHEVDKRYLCKDGRCIWVHVSVCLLRDAAGQPQSYLASVVDITDRKRAEEEAEQAAATQAAIIQAQHEIARLDLDMQGAMDLLAEQARTLVGATGGVIGLVEEDGEMVCRAVAGVPAGILGARPQRDASLSGLAVSSGEAQVCDDAELDERVDRALCRRVGLRSMVVVPLGAGEKIIGALMVFSDQPEAFAPKDVRNLRILVESAGVVIQRHRADEQLRASEARYRLLFEHNPNPMWAYDCETLQFLTVNPAAVRLYGYSEAEFLAMTLRDIRPPEEMPGLEATLAALRAGGTIFGAIRRHRCKDGSIIDVEVSFDEFIFEGRPAGLVLAQDVTARCRAERELARANRALTMLRACGEALIRREGEAELLDAVCRMAVQVGGYRMAWVGYAQDDAKHSILPAAHAGAEDGYLSEVSITWDEKEQAGQGPIGRMIRAGHAVVCEDMESDVNFAPWRESARRRGYRSGIFLALRDGGETFGVLALYSAEKNEAGAEEIDLLQEMADDLAFGILSLRMQEDRERLQAAVMKVATAVSAAAGAEFFQQLARNMAEAVGADAGFVSRLIPGEPRSARTLAAVVDGEVVENFEYLLEGTACERMLTTDACVIPRGAAAQFPSAAWLVAFGGEGYVGHRLADSADRIVGGLFVVFRQPIKNVEFVTSTVRIFAARVAAEMEREAVDAITREQAALLDNARDAILVRDLDRRITYWNRSAERLYGWPAEEMIGKVAAEVTFKDWQPIWEAEQQVALTGEWIGEFQQIARDGRELTVESRWTLMRDAAGQPKSVLIINTDVTERTRQQEAFLITAKRAELAAKASKVGIWDWDVTTGAIHWDDQMFLIYGEDPAGGQNGFEIWRRHLHPEDRDRAHAELEESLRSDDFGTDGFSFRILVPAPHGEIRHIRGQRIIFRDAAGRPTRVLGTNWDVTRQVRREEALRNKLEEEKLLRQQAIAGEQAKREFLAVMSHEIRTPMHGVLGFAEMLLQSPTLTPENRDLSQTIVSSGEALLRILDDILDFSRIEAGRLSIEKQPFALRELLESIRLLFLKRIQEKGLSFVMLVEDGLPGRLVGDAGRIRQILVNLIGNALKFTEQGSIEVAVRRPRAAAPGEWVEFAIRDTGPGIAADRVEAIFEAFTQADSSISRRHGGTGLGLTISRRLAELMGGALVMSSELGKGTTFTARIPLASAASSASAARAGGDAGSPLDEGFAARHPLRILVVEDDQVNLKLIVGVLRKLGYSPLAARNGVEAVALYKMEDIDCVFMDMQMPEMDGMEATERIRAWERSRAVRPAYISALTANILPEDQQRCFEAGMDFYLNKPVKRQAIVDVLIEAFKVRRAGIG